MHEATKDRRRVEMLERREALPANAAMTMLAPNISCSLGNQKQKSDEAGAPWTIRPG
jgi:hypothetical protein